MDEVTNTDEENKKTIIMFTARDMAIGAAMKKNEYIATGISIGVVGTALAFMISNKIKNKEKEVVVYDIDTNKVSKEKGDIEEVFEEISASEEQPEVTEDIKVNKKSKKNTEDEKEKSIIDKVNDILKKPSNLEDLQAVIKELNDNEKK
jgi:hypothetical protein